MARIAVVGHVEWVQFLSLAKLPAHGQITPAERVRVNAAGGAVVAATVLARLGAEVEFFGAVGADDLGDQAIAQLELAGISAHCVRRPSPSREVITFLDNDHERSIVTLGERLAPAGDDELDWARLEEMDGVYFTAGDQGALAHARRARLLTTTPRIAEQLINVDVELDALIYSGDDHAEVDWAGQLASHARLQVITDGGHGGRWTGASRGSWEPVERPGPFIDSYGAGDSFAAGFTYGLAVAGDPREAARTGAECGARALTHAGGP
ncbi:MAG: hypothetical protein J2O48_13965 [Solirubrobacterales bacterium]|nr:hypothetical protein [Solirubrobacterales bacterium]